MKKLLIIALLLPVFSFFGCPEDLLEIKFSMDMADVEFKIKPNAEAGIYALDTAEVTSTLKEELDKHGADISKLTSIHLKSAILTILSPDGQTFSPVDNAVLFMETNVMPQTNIADVNNDGASVEKLDLDVNSDLDLIEAMKDELIRVSGNVTTNSAVDEEITMRAKITVEVVADPLD